MKIKKNIFSSGNGILLFFIILVAFGFASSTYADNVKFRASSRAITATEICLNGNLFLVTVITDGISTIQVMQHEKRFNKMIPVTCTRIQGQATKFITSQQE